MEALKDATVVVTGGSAGIGLALARRLLRAGAHPIILGRSAERLATARRAEPSLDGFVCDVTHRDAAEQIRSELHARGAQLEILINNAGVQHTCEPESLAWATPGGVSEEIDTNVHALTRLSYALLPDLAQSAKHGYAALINVSSGLALAPKKSSPIYCATKAYVRSFTRSLRYRVEDAALGVHVMEALPPLVDTNMTAGRGKGKISSDQCARQIVRDLCAGKHESHVGKVKLLSTLQRVSPSLAYRIVRDW